MPYLNESPKVEYIRPNSHIEVKAIASFACGKIKPLYFEYDGQTIKIDCVQFSEPIMGSFGFTFYCDVTVYDCVKTVKLAYHKNDFKWFLVG